MDSKKAEALRKKYWGGKSSLDEEKELKSHFLHGQDDGDPDQEYFNYLKNKNAQSPLDDQFDEKILKLIGTDEQSKKQKNSALKYWIAAASLALIITVSVISSYDFIDKKEVVADTYEDPEKAFEETKRALLLLSSRLNQSDEYATQFSNFEKSQKHLKQN